MSYDPQTSPDDKKSFFGIIVHSFFVVPFILAIFSVLLFVGMRILTMEQRNVYDYLEDVREGGLTKRWQAAFELSRILSDKSNVPTDDKFIRTLTEAYVQSSHDDPRVRQYLILAMAKSGRKEFSDELLKNISQEKDENLYATIAALGILQASQSVPVLLTYLKDDNKHVRLACVIALGFIGDSRSIDLLKGMLNDNEPNIMWDSAVALAKMGDSSGKEILLKLLDRNYLNQFTEVDIHEQSKIIQVVIEASVNLKDKAIDDKIANLLLADKNMNVRSTAKKAIEKQKNF